MRLAKHLLSAFVILLGIAFLFSQYAHAQAVAVAEAASQVLDPTGSAVSGATVKMIETARGVSHDTQTDESGADAFNVINHTNLGAATQTGVQIPVISSGVTTALNSSPFGRITGAGDPRIFQFAMKILF